MTVAQQLLVLNTGPGEAAFNMALDEALMETVPALRAPVLRLYGWVQPAATFGYFQRYEDVATLTPLRPLIRRPTGGGIVPHDADWTYSLAVPTGVPWYEFSAIESYRAIHASGSAAASNCLGSKRSWLSPRKPAWDNVLRVTRSSTCFIKDRKIAGAAQRRTKTALLIQGSIQPPTKDAFACGMGAADAARGNCAWLRAGFP